MKKHFITFLLLTVLAAGALAQRMSAPSPSSTIQQAVGVTDFTVSYSRPSLKGRAAFGPGSALAPLGTMWRTGANAATTLEASTDFTFGGKNVPAGKYALFTIPNSGSWTVILNKDFKGGVYTYAQSNDVARVEITPVSGGTTETFTISFDNLTESSANLTLWWAGISVPVKLGVATDELTAAGIREAVAKNPEDQATLQRSAGYYLSKGTDLDQALALADKSVGIKETFANVWLKAQILQKMGKLAEAVPLAQKALDLGAASGDNAFNSNLKGQIENSLADWKSKLPAEVPSKLKGKKKKK
ncbi:DUF2911 domain-containing protein [Ravibacter arvi]|uniref:DUF2911 domain-containing protein n=1 Tax=Ravibacter arvi TaxID=2051041 RepID=A0ABP8M6A2_9BACT